MPGSRCTVHSVYVVTSGSNVLSSSTATPSSAVCSRSTVTRGSPCVLLLFSYTLFSRIYLTINNIWHFIIDRKTTVNRKILVFEMSVVKLQ